MPPAARTTIGVCGRTFVVPSLGVTLTVAGAAAVGVLLVVLGASVGVVDARGEDAPDVADEHPDITSAAHSSARP